MTDDRGAGPAEAGHDTASSLIAAAQKAIGHGDYSEAERLLREAAGFQEAALGGDHPDLATTLNNLAYVCEQTGNIDEAERGYRRAHRIAVASLSPGHPFIKTSLSNLMEFCEARGIPIWTRPERPVEDEPLPDEIDLDTTTRDDDRHTDDARIEPLHVEAPAIVIPPAIVHQPTLASRLPLPMITGSLLVIVVLVVVAFARRGNEANDEPGPVAYARTTTASSAVVAPAPSGPPSPSEPEPAPAPPRAPELPTAAPTPRPAPVNAHASVTVLNAQLCSALAKHGSPDWQCTSAGRDLPPGRYIFYTRLLTTAGTTVEHRWYFSGRLHQTMRLRVSPNPVGGYRTFSTTTVSPERAGAWKVELRAADGTVLDEAQFAVR